jgi:UDP-N-acetylglucosamine acyltransferase
VTNRIHPSAVLIGEIEMGSDNLIGPGAVITGPLIIGSENVIGPYAILGGPPQDTRVRLNGHTNLLDGVTDGPLIKIGNSNVFREFVTVHHPLSQHTLIGSYNYFMTQSHIPHDCEIEDHVKIANSAQIAGYSQIMSHSYIGLGVAVHQFTVVGAYSMIGMNSTVIKHVLPGSVVVGSPAYPKAPNRIALSQIGLDDFSWWDSYLTNPNSSNVPEPLFSAVERWNLLVASRVSARATLDEENKQGSLSFWQK